MSPIKAQNDEKAPEITTTEDADIESIDSAGPEDLATTPGTLPTDSNGSVPSGTIIRFGRTPKGQEPKGLFFATEHGNELSQIFFVKSWDVIAKASKDEVVIERGMPGGGVVGGVNFHHWLVDQSTAIIVHNEHGHETNLKRVGWNKHSFDLGEQKLFWRQSSGKGELEDKSYMRRHLECLDEQGTMYAFYTSESSYCWGSRKLGRLELKVDGLPAEKVEMLLMTFTAVYVKLQKRIMQNSQAGNLGGLVTAVMRTVQG